MKDDDYLKTEVVNDCFSEIHTTVARYIKRNHFDEALLACSYLIANNILTICKLHKLNVEQYMEETFDRITKIVSRLEKEIK